MSENITTIDSDVESDAEAVSSGIQGTRNGADYLALNVSVRQAGAQQDRVADKGAAVANRKHKTQNDNTIDVSKYLKFFDEKLKDEPIDILILNSGEDYKEATNLKILIEKNARFCDGLTPKVTLLQDVISDYAHNQLSEAYERTLFIFFYVSKRFCNDKFILHQSYSVLRKMYTTDNSKVVIVVRTNPELYNVTIELDGVLTLEDFHGTLIEKVNDILEKKSKHIFDGRQHLHEGRQKHVKKNLDELMSKEKYFQILLSETTSVTDSGSKSNEKFQSKKSVESEKKDKNVIAEIPQQMSQCSLSNEQTSVKNLEDETLSIIQLDGGDIEKATNESNYCSYSQTDSDNDMLSDKPSLELSLPAQEALIAEEITLGSSRVQSHENLHSEQMENNENNDSCSSDVSDSQNSTVQENSTTSSSKAVSIDQIHTNDADTELDKRPLVPHSTSPPVRPKKRDNAVETVFDADIDANDSEQGILLGNIRVQATNDTNKDLTSANENKLKIQHSSARPSFCCCKNCCILS